jgi:RNA-binding protein Musashi
MLNPYITSNSNRFNNNTPIGYNGGTGRNDSVLNSPNRNVWGNGGLTNDPNTTFGSGTGNFGVSYGNDTANWSHSFGAGQGGGRSSGVNMNFVGGDNMYGLGGGVYGRNRDTSVAPTSPFLASSGGFAEGSYGDFCRGGSVYGDSPWRSELDGSGPFAYGLRDEDSDVKAKSSEGYVGSYNAPSRQSNRGIAA